VHEPERVSHECETFSVCLPVHQAVSPVHHLLHMSASLTWTQWVCKECQVDEALAVLVKFALPSNAFNVLMCVIHLFRPPQYEYDEDKVSPGLHLHNLPQRGRMQYGCNTSIWPILGICWVINQLVLQICCWSSWNSISSCVVPIVEHMGGGGSTRPGP
jgi:hypothetical protein